MESPEQTAVRLLAVLEEMVEQEAALFRAGTIEDAVGLQLRAAPLVERLGQLAAVPEVTVLRPRVAALLARRQQSSECLQGRIDRTGAEIRRIEGARSRLAQVAPAYAGAPGFPASSRLNAAV